MTDWVEFRSVPIFDELLDFLFELYNGAAGQYVVTHRSLVGMTRQQRKSYAHKFWKGIRRAIKRCGVDPWKRPFRTLRSHRENELMREGVMTREQILYVIGHNKATSDAHYKAGVKEEELREALGFVTSDLTSNLSTSVCTTPKQREGASGQQEVTTESKDTLRLCADRSWLVAFQSATNRRLEKAVHR